MKSHNIEAIGRLQSRKKNLTKRQLPWEHWWVWSLPRKVTVV